ncbi:MAG: FixH family protein [Pleurocapsa sp. SU_196_0]|nr:FixH family protein [Pleurocapsa sp. SU_196_0]
MRPLLPLLFLLFVACVPPTQNQLGVTLEPFTQTIGRRGIVLNITRDGKPLTEASVSIEGNMTHAGMGVVRDTATELEAGRYRITAFDFNMSGDWILTVTAKTDEETLTGEVRLEVKP